MNLVFQRNARSRLKTVQPLFERLQTDRHQLQEMVLRCPWSTERSMGNGFTKMIPPSEDVEMLLLIKRVFLHTLISNRV